MMFNTIVCGVDGSDAGFVALEQARRLMAPDGRLIAVTVCNDTLAVHAGLNAAAVAAEMRAEAAATRALAERQLAGLEHSSAVVTRGRPVRALRQMIDDERADAIVVGGHGTSRAAGLLLGSVASRMLREAPCAVLVARPQRSMRSFPETIVVGVDGSAQAAYAHDAAMDIAERTGAAVRAVAALGGKGVDLAAIPARAEHDSRGPLVALEAASADADLLVVGSRGLHGFAALGSVSERIAHRARCSVLVVRPGAAIGYATAATYTTKTA